MKKGIIFAEFPAPYRVAVFEIIAQKYAVEVFYEFRNTEERSDDYTVKSASYPYEFLCEEKGRNRFNEVCRNLKEYDFVLDYNACIKDGTKLAFRSLMCGVPYFINNDGGFVRHNFIKDSLKKVMFKNASLCLAAGNVSMEYFMAYGVKKERIRLHNFTSLTKADILSSPISINEKNRIRKELGLNDKVIVISVGQFIERKGFDLLLQAWKEKSDKDNSVLIIIGGGNKKNEYEKYIKDNNLDDVILFDFFPKDDLIKHYKAADIFVMPTREDVWGLVINEAMSMGLPIIATDKCLAAKELVCPEVNGYIYNVQDIRRLAYYIDELIRNDDLRKVMSKNNIDKMQTFTMENIGKVQCEAIEQFFDGAIK